MPFLKVIKLSHSAKSFARARTPVMAYSFCRRSSCDETALALLILTEDFEKGTAVLQNRQALPKTGAGKPKGAWPDSAGAILIKRSNHQNQ